jgi:uncharacterized membrane protein YedE/YeeE
LKELLSGPWPWWVAGPVIGLFVPALLLAGNKLFGVSSSLRHMCAAAAPGSLEHFRYNWRESGWWNLLFVLGTGLGGFVAAQWLGAHEIGISEATRTALGGLGIHDFSGLAPREVFSWEALGTVRGFISVVVGGFLVGFGTAWAGGCTSGHAISGMADFQLPSLLAVIGFFAGGLLGTHVVLPWIF